MTAVDPIVAEPPPVGQIDVAARYRLWSEGSVRGTDDWEVLWLPVPPADVPPVVRRLSRERFLMLDATGRLDSCYALSARSLASLLGESLPLGG
jgi:hypothetical protein